MLSSISGKVLLAGTLLAASIHPRVLSQTAGLDLGLTYSTEHAQLAPGTCGCFWLQGGEADVALTARKGFGIAAAISGETVSNYAPGIDFTKISFLGGPRFTYTLHRRGAAANVQIFGEGLFGGAHATSGAFPTGATTTTTANSFALQTGGGLNLRLSRHLGLRLFELDYVRTQLPNSYDNTQNDLRLAFGLSYHAGTAP